MRAARALARYPGRFAFESRHVPAKQAIARESRHWRHACSLIRRQRHGKYAEEVDIDGIEDV